MSSTRLGRSVASQIWCKQRWDSPVRRCICSSMGLHTHNGSWPISLLSIIYGVWIINSLQTAIDGDASRFIVSLQANDPLHRGVVASEHGCQVDLVDGGIIVARPIEVACYLVVGQPFHGTLLWNKKIWEWKSNTASSIL